MDHIKGSQMIGKPLFSITGGSVVMHDAWPVGSHSQQQFPGSLVQEPSLKGTLVREPFSQLLHPFYSLYGVAVDPLIGGAEPVVCTTVGAPAALVDPQLIKLTAIHYQGGRCHHFIVFLICGEGSYNLLEPGKTFIPSVAE